MAALRSGAPWCGVRTLTLLHIAKSDTWMAGLRSTLAQLSYSGGGVLARHLHLPLPELALKLEKGICGCTVASGQQMQCAVQHPEDGQWLVG